MKDYKVTHPLTPEGQSIIKIEAHKMEWLWFAGVILLYFALQLWILPKMGIST